MKFSLKKTVGIGLGSLSALSAVTQVLASSNTITLDPCANMQSPWNKLCVISTSNIPQIIGNGVLLLFVFATLIALFFLIWGGIKWILSGGDKTKVETARATIIAALIGLVVTFLSFFILQLILGLFGINLMNLQIPNLI